MLKKVLRTHLDHVIPRNLYSRRELAFFGGSFTGIPLDRQKCLLSAVKPWIFSGEIQSIRVSTHALFIDDNRLKLLKDNYVETVELGIQSTDNEVLRIVGRECPFDDYRPHYTRPRVHHAPRRPKLSRPMLLPSHLVSLHRRFWQRASNH